MIGVYTLLVGLGSYRLWRITGEDTITSRFREWLYDLADRNVVASFFADLNSCVWCLGWWYAGALSWLVADVEDYDPTQFALVWLAGSALAGLTRALVNSLSA